MSQYNRIRPVHIEATKRRAEALNLRTQGLSYKSVFEAMIAKFGRDALPDSYDERNCYKDIAYELDRLRKNNIESAHMLRMVQSERLDQLLTATMMIAMDYENSPETRLKAIDRVLNIENQRAKLYGLYAPAQVKVSDWRSEIIELVKSGKLTKQQVEQELGSDVTRELLESGSIDVVEGRFTEEESSPGQA